MSVALRDLDRFLRHAESVIGLIERCQPLNGRRELRRLLEAWQAGRTEAPLWVYRPPPDLTAVLQALEGVIEQAGVLGSLGGLYAGRALELWHEARAAEALGTGEFASRAAARFPLDEAEGAAQVTRWADEWMDLEVGEPERVVLSDDDRHQESLLSLMRGAVGKLRLPVRIVVVDELASHAAAGDGVVCVKARVPICVAEARRIVLHEVYGHVLPRVRAGRFGVGILSIGTRRGSDDEEGRALLLERRAQLFTARRRRELGLRHRAAVSVRQGGSFCDTARLMQGRGATLGEALALAARAHRGGGLAREVVYLPALYRVARALTADPSLETWLEHGRVSVEAAHELRRLAGPLVADASDGGVSAGARASFAGEAFPVFS